MKYLLSDVAVVQTHFFHADFWIVPSGSRMGMLMYEFHADYIGVMFTYDAITKLCVMPNKFQMWFANCWRAGALSAICDLADDGELLKIAPERLQKLKMPIGMVHETAA